MIQRFKRRFGAVVLMLLLGIGLVSGQTVDTVTVMTYNLLFYGANTSFCTTGNNNLQTKNGHLRTIVSHVQPDIIGVQEMASNVGTTLTFLNEVLNFGGVNRWARANFVNTTSSNIISILYYDVNKFGIASQQPIQTSLRDIMYYRLFYKEIPPAGDTIFLNVAVMHLKAGSSTSDVSQRGGETLAMMNFLNAQNLRGNLVVMGDFNTNSSNEPAYVNMISYSNADIRLLDPVNRSGTWWNNVAFADLHTQSTRVTSDGCKSGGGLDDRYDQILINEFVRADSARVRYIPGSYKTIGNDGQRFKGNLNTPFNGSAPTNVITALYEASDHLPVILKLRINAGFGVSVPEAAVLSWRFEVGTLAEEALHYFGSVAEAMPLRWEITNLTGQSLAAGELFVDRGDFRGSLPVQELSAGIYLLRLRDGQGQHRFIRFVKR
jgi:endonuclease/exonuclease/phosphatase family metal-dependent hydrolase